MIRIVSGSPKGPACQIALEVMRDHESRFDPITACVFDSESAALYERTLRRLRA